MTNFPLAGMTRSEHAADLNSTLTLGFSPSATFGLGNKATSNGDSPPDSRLTPASSSSSSLPGGFRHHAASKQMRRFTGLYTGPYFDPVGNPENVTAQLGQTAVIPCMVKQIGDNLVSCEGYYQLFCHSLWFEDNQSGETSA